MVYKQPAIFECLCCVCVPVCLPPLNKKKLVNGAEKKLPVDDHVPKIANLRNPFFPLSKEIYIFLMGGFGCRDLGFLIFICSWILNGEEWRIP